MEIAAETAYWSGRDEAMAHAMAIGQRYGRPIVTGLGVAEDEVSWFIRVDFHSMQDGESFLIVRNPLDERAIAVEVQRILDVNQVAVLADLEAMNDAYEKQQAAEAAHEKRRAASLKGWVKRHERRVMQGEQNQQMLKRSDTHAE